MSDAAAPPTTAPAPEVAAPGPEAKTQSAPATQSAPQRKFRYVVDGEDRELTEAQVITRLQKEDAADKRMQQAAEAKKKVDSLLKELDDDLEGALAKLGKDPSKLISSYMEKKARLEMMTPEQRAAEALRQERDTYKQRVEAHEKAQKEALEAAAFERHILAVEKQFIAEADKYGLEGTPEQLEELADIAHKILEYTNRPPTLTQVFEEYLREEEEYVSKRDKKRLSGKTGKDLLKWLGKDVTERVKKALAEEAAESLKSIPAPQKPVKNGKNGDHKPFVREGKGHIKETDFDRKFGL